MGTLFRDLRYGVRMLIQKPGFTLAAVAVLALGIGANTAIFSIVNAFLLKPLLIQNPNELVGCFSRDTTKPDTYRAFSYPNYADLRDHNQVFSSLMAHNMAMVGLQEGDTTRRVFADIVTSNYFSTFGVSLLRGRAFTAEEERPGSGIPVTVVSYSYWTRHGADPGLLGKTLRINSRSFTIVGIAPEGFTGTTAMLGSEMYVPLGMYEAVINDFEGHGRKLAERDNDNLILVGRLRPGLTLSNADSQLAGVAASMEKAFPVENKNQTLLVRPLSRLSVSTAPVNDNPIVVASALLLSVAGAVLLIASLNVANMMLARGAARRKEIAIRLALGGGRRSIVQQLLTEGLMLALLGGAAGLLVAYWCTGLLIQSMTRLVPLELVFSAAPDPRVLLATMAFCVLSTLLFGLGPAWNLSRRSVLSGLKDGAPEDDGAKPRRWFSRRNLLVMSQISLSLMLLTTAGLFIRSATRAAAVEPGFRMELLLVVEVDPSLAGYNEERGRQLYKTLVERLGSIPGVESVSLAATVPFGMMSLGRDIRRAEDASGKENKVACQMNIVGDGYFKTLGIPLLRGRAFQAAETGGKAPLVAILDRSAADRLWPKGDAVGQRIRTITQDSQPQPDVEVIGVVGNVQEHIFGAEAQPHVYVPLGQEYQSNMNLHLRIAAGGPGEPALLETVRREIRAVDDRLPILALNTMRGQLESSADTWTVRTGARILSIFGGVALLLAMIGLYGVRAYTVAMRTREIGIRMALGASAGDTLGAILREGLIVTAIATVAGLLLSLAVGTLLASFLYRVSGADPLVFVGAPLLLAAVSLLACYLPARRAARVDPMVALRNE